MSFDADDYYNDDLQEFIKETELHQLPHLCEHPFDSIEVDNITFNSKMSVVGVLFICKKCNISLRRWVKVG
jgi:hypothetical protein